jgi:hypothetical protein
VAMVLFDVYYWNFIYCAVKICFQRGPDTLRQGRMRAEEEDGVSDSSRVQARLGSGEGTDENGENDRIQQLKNPATPQNAFDKVEVLSN